MLTTFERPYPACPDGYFYGGEIQQSSHRDMVVEKGETSPTYRCYNCSRQNCKIFKSLELFVAYLLMRGIKITLTVATRSTLGTIIW